MLALNDDGNKKLNDFKKIRVLHLIICIFSLKRVLTRISLRHLRSLVSY